MRDGWTETTIGEITELVPGKYIPKSDYVENGQFFIYGSNSVMGKYSHSLIDGPHTVMAAIGAYAGAVRYSPVPSWVNNNAFGLITNSEIQPKYLFLWLATNLDLATVVAGTGQPYVQRPMLQSTSITMPPLAEQKRIVDVVSSVDAYIDALHQQADSARIARKAIEVAEFDNPENELSVLGDYCDKTDIQVGPFGSQLHQHEYVADGIPVVMPKNIVDGRISEKNIARITPEKASELKRHILMPGDVLFARRGDLSKRALVTEAQVGWLCGTGTVRVRSKKLDGAILFRLTNTSDVNTWLMDNSVGATMPNLNTAIVASIPLRVPANALEAVALLRGMDEYLDGLTNSIRSAMELRSGLLSDLLSGEHEIPESYDRFLKAA